MCKAKLCTKTGHSCGRDQQTCTPTFPKPLCTTISAQGHDCNKGDETKPLQRQQNCNRQGTGTPKSSKKNYIPGTPRTQKQATSRHPKLEVANRLRSPPNPSEHNMKQPKQPKNYLDSPNNL
ncbi:hypothetical protein U1Q18_039430 [Sarracenia purpurea var. burkii]